VGLHRGGEFGDIGVGVEYVTGLKREEFLDRGSAKRFLDRFQEGEGGRTGQNIFQGGVTGQNIFLENKRYIHISAWVATGHNDKKSQSFISGWR
jgi:hypothetical protein